MYLSLVPVARQRSALVRVFLRRISVLFFVGLWSRHHPMPAARAPHRVPCCEFEESLNHFNALIQDPASLPARGQAGGGVWAVAAKTSSRPRKITNSLALQGDSGWRNYDESKRRVT